jgi:hypothetical protein
MTRIKESGHRCIETICESCYQFGSLLKSIFNLDFQGLKPFIL